MVSQALISTALMGLLLVAVFVGVSRIGSQRERAAAAEGDRYDAVGRQLSAAAASPVVWTLGFVALALGVGLVAVLAVGGFEVSEELAPALYRVTLAAVGVLLAGFLFLGAYFGARQRGLGNAHSVAVGLGGLGGGVLLLIAARLVLS